MKPYLRRRLLVVGCLILLLASSGCATIDLFASKPAETPAGSDRELVRQAEAAIALKKYDEGRKHLQHLINHFPESEMVPTARLSVGRTYFDEKGTMRRASSTNGSSNCFHNMSRLMKPSTIQDSLIFVR